MKKKDILTPGCVSLFFAMTFIFFAPMEVILMNSDEFHYRFTDFWWFQLLLVLGATVVLTVVLCLLRGKIRTAATGLLLGTGTAAWVQMMFMNGKMIRLTGDQMQISGAEKALNLVIWLVIAGGITAACLILEKKGKKIRIPMCALAGFLTVIQLAAFASLLFSTEISDTRDGHIVTKKGEFELSRKNNAIVFLLDTADGEYVHQVLDTYPEVREEMDGWVYYPNAVSEYSRTFPSLPYLLTGEKCYLDIPLGEFIDSAYEKGDFLPKMYNNGTDIGVFTMDLGYVSTNMDGMIGNMRKSKPGIGDMDLIGLEKGLARISLFKCMPYFCKNWFKYEVGILNITAFKERNYIWFDPYVYGDLVKEGGVKVTDAYDKTFRFYHLWSAHPTAEWNEELEIIKGWEAEPYQRLRGSFKILKEFCDQLKEAGIYDETLIIAVADHGKTTGDPDLLIQDKAACPMMMVKYPHHEGTGQMEISKAPVHHDDMFATVTDALGIERTNCGSGRSLAEIAEDEERDRIYYYTATNRHITPILMREYVIQGDAEDISNWKETGNTWEAKIGW